MGFYEQLSKYYEDIFPTSKIAVEFIASVAGEPEKELLDVACGAGGHSLELAKRGFNMTSSDLDEKMIVALNHKAKEQQLDITSAQENMLDIHGKFDKKFDVIFCIGNSIVHLDSKKEIQMFFSNMFDSLHAYGKFIVQIVNFDKVLLSDDMKLPLIQNDAAGVTFERFYKNAEEGKVIFATTLTVDNSEERLTAENKILLTPVNSTEIVEMLEVAGFSKVKLFGDFNSNEYVQKSSNAIIALAEK